MKVLLFTIIAWSSATVIYFLIAVITQTYNPMHWTSTWRISSVIIWIVYSILITALFNSIPPKDPGAQARQDWDQIQRINKPLN